MNLKSTEAGFGNVSRDEWIADASPLLYHANYLTTVPEFVVVPNIKNHPLSVVDDRRLPVDYTSVSIPYEIRRHDFWCFNEINLSL